MNKEKQPAFFISHGSPMLAIDNSETAQFLSKLGQTIAPPKAIVVFSAHLDIADDVIITSGNKPDLIYDFYGFPQPLYEIKYPAPGSPVLANKMATILKAGGVSPRLDSTLGWDHGVWMPLYLMFPEANIPIVQISISSALGSKHNYTIGNLLASLREEGVMFIGSGGISHNLRELFSAQPTPNREKKVDMFTSWVAEQLEQKNPEALVNYMDEAPYVLFNHPTQEHFLPLINILGSTKNEKVSRIHNAIQNEVLALDAYQFS